MREPSTWDQVFFDMAFAIAERSKDPSTQCGAVLIESNTHVVLSTGFNGPPPQIVDKDVPWDKRPEKYAYIIHAEENCLHFALESHGKLPYHQTTIYCTNHPCSDCMLRLIRNNVDWIVIPESHKPYPMSKYQVEPLTLIEAQVYPKIKIRFADYVPKQEISSKEN